MTNPHVDDHDPQEMTRRDFMDRSIKAIGAFIGITMGVPTIGYLISPALQRQAGGWIRLGRVSEVEVGVPTLFTITVDKTTGWVKSEIDMAFFVYTEDGVNFAVMSNICTHLGCRTHWNEAGGYILCPCHDGHFDMQGNVIGGPPPRSLKRVEFQVDDDDTILIQEA